MLPNSPGILPFSDWKNLHCAWDNVPDKGGDGNPCRGTVLAFYFAR